MEKKRDSNEALLVKTSNIVEFEYITDMLSEMDISFKAEEESREQYVSLMEGRDTGISIYVDKSRLDEAKQLLTPLDTDLQEYDEICEVQEDELIGEQVLEVAQKATGVFKKAFVYPVIIIAALLLLKFLDSIAFGEYISYIIRLVFGW